MSFSFGSDPEFMIAKDGKYKSAIGIVHGDVENRINISGHQFYYDNILAECAIKPSNSKEQAVDNFRECLSLLVEMVQPFQVVVQAAQNYDQSELVHPDAKKVNCDPEFCPYEMKMCNGPVDAIMNGTLRTCGGHIHLGKPELNEGSNGLLSMLLMDLFVGVPSLWMDNNDPSTQIRREMYGAAGRYRVKDYGMEYRSLSNFWLKSPRLVSYMYQISEFVADLACSDEGYEHWDFNWELYSEFGPSPKVWTCKTYDAQKLRDGIRTGDKSLVLNHFELAQKLMPDDLRKEMLALCETQPKSLKEEWGIKA